MGSKREVGWCKALLRGVEGRPGGTGVKCFVMPVGLSPLKLEERALTRINACF